jgi:protoheme IX farnesyltransferase
MKAEVSSVSLPAVPLVSDLAELFKARLSLLVVLTTLAGFFAATSGALDWTVFVGLILGTAASAAGASALNQWWERDLDAKMRRTKDRPLPGGRLHPSDALGLGLLLSFSGVACLAVLTHPLAAGLSAFTIASYVLLYTPMKQISTLNTLVGAVPGALPPLIGWTAATGSIGMPGLLLFALMWFWQMPHFLAISWIYREDYARAGFIMLSREDEAGTLTARQSLIYSIYLLGISVMPIVLGFVQVWFWLPAIILGGGFLFCALQFFFQRTKLAARRLFLYSILWLPCYLGAYLFARN